MESGALVLLLMSLWASCVPLSLSFPTCEVGVIRASTLQGC